MLFVFLRGVLDDGKDTFHIEPVSGYKVSMTRAIQRKELMTPKLYTEFYATIFPEFSWTHMITSSQLVAYSS